MPAKRPILLSGCAFLLLICAGAVKAQWVPQKVVGIEYSKYATLAKIQGEVELLLSIKSDGTVASAQPIGNPHRLLSEIAQENAIKWVFRDHSESKSSPPTAKVIYSFRLEGEAKANVEPRRQFIFEYPSNVNVISEFWNSKRYEAVP